MEEKEMNRTVYPVHYRSKFGWLLTKASELFLLFVTVFLEIFVVAFLWDGFVVNCKFKSIVLNRILISLPGLLILATVIFMGWHLFQHKTIELTDWSLSIRRHNIMLHIWDFRWNDYFMLSEITKVEIADMGYWDVHFAYINLCVFGADYHHIVIVSTQDRRSYYVPVDDPEAFVADLTARMEKAGKYRRFDGIWRDKAEDHIQ